MLEVRHDVVRTLPSTVDKHSGAQRVASRTPLDVVCPSVLALVLYSNQQRKHEKRADLPMPGLGEQDLHHFRWISLQRPYDGGIIREPEPYSGDEALCNPCLAQEVLDQPSF